MSESSHGQAAPERTAFTEARLKRWDLARQDVPADYGNDELLRSIAADARRATDSLKTIAMWATIAGLCVIVITLVVVVLALGGVTLTFEVA